MTAYNNTNLLPTIKQLCKQRNITLKELSETLGFSSGLMFRWDKNIPSVEKINLIADYFNVSVDYLLGKTDIPSKIDDILSDPDILTIQRLHSNLSKKNKAKMMQLLKIQFDEDFPKEVENIDANKE